MQGEEGEKGQGKKRVRERKRETVDKTGLHTFLILQYSQKAKCAGSEKGKEQIALFDFLHLSYRGNLNFAKIHLNVRKCCSTEKKLPPQQVKQTLKQRYPLSIGLGKE